MDRPAMSYLAIVSERPDRLSDFYQTYFGLTELGRSDAGDVSVTDGHFNLTFVKRRAGLDEDEAGPGLHHFGIAVEDIDEIKARLKEDAPFANLREESGDLHHGEYRVTDPNGYPVSLSTRHFGVTPRPRGFPSLRHIALSVPNREAVTAFFVNVFGFRETSVSQQRRATNQPARHLGDGTTNLAVLPDPDLIRQLGEEREVAAEYQAINTRPGRRTSASSCRTWTRSWTACRRSCREQPTTDKTAATWPSAACSIRSGMASTCRSAWASRWNSTSGCAPTDAGAASFAC